MKIVVLALAPLGLAFTSPVLAQSSDSGEASSKDPHVAMVEALTNAEGFAATQANALRDVRQAYQKDPNIADIEGQCPGTVDVLVETTRPILYDYSILEAELRRDALVAVLREEISAEHAQAAADFYGSDVGQRMVVAIMSNRTMEKMMESAMENIDEGIIDADSVAADNRKSVEDGIRSMTQEDRADLNTMAAGQPWLAELARVRPKLFEAGMKVTNSDFAPHLDARLDRDIEAALATHLEACGY